MKILFPGFKLKCLTFSYDDGTTQDIKLAEIFRKNNLKATFNINTGEMGTKGRLNYGGYDVPFDRLCEDELNDTYKDMEVISHGLTHADYTGLDEDALRVEILTDIDNISRILNKEKVKGSAYPYGRYDDETIKRMYNMGIRYARTIDETHTFDIPEDFLKWHPTCHDADNNINDLIEKFLKDDNEIKLFYIWGHGFELDMGDKDRWGNIEKTCRKLSNHEDVWYASNSEIYEYISKSRELVKNENVIENKSDIDMYLEVCGKQVILKGGEKICIA